MFWYRQKAFRVNSVRQARAVKSVYEGPVKTCHAMRFGLSPVVRAPVRALIQASLKWENPLMALDAADFESFINLGDSLGQLELIAGPKARPLIAMMRNQLAAAAAKRQAGDAQGALALITQAMSGLVAIGMEVDSSEGAMMRAIADRFGQALSGGDKGSAKEAVALMRHKAGDPKDDSHGDW
jgi:hypothetical protein